MNDLSQKIRSLTEGIFNNKSNVEKTANYENRLGKNFIRAVLTEGILCKFLVGK